MECEHVSKRNPRSTLRLILYTSFYSRRSEFSINLRNISGISIPLQKLPNNLYPVHHLKGEHIFE